MQSRKKNNSLLEQMKLESYRAKIGEHVDCLVGKE